MWAAKLSQPVWCRPLCGMLNISGGKCWGGMYTWAMKIGERTTYMYARSVTLASLRSALCLCKQGQGRDASEGSLPVPCLLISRAGCCWYDHWAATCVFVRFPWFCQYRIWSWLYYKQYSIWNWWYYWLHMRVWISLDQPLFMIMGIVTLRA